VLLLGVTFGEVGLAWRPRFAAALGRFGLPLTLAAAADYAIHMSDRLFLAHVSKAEVGVYSLAYTFAFLLSILVTDSFFKSWSVSLYSYAAQPGWQARFSNICAWLVLVLGGAALGISLFGRDLLTVLTPASYYPPMMMLPVLVWGYFFRGFGDFFRDILLIGIGSGTVGRITSFCAVLNILLNFCFIPTYGIWGATWCTFATWVVYAGISWAWAWRTHGIVIQLRPLVTMLLICGVILAVFDAARPESVWLRLAIDCGLFGAFLVATAVFCLGRAERGEAWRYVGGYVAKLRPAGAGQ
jgi:O-antigen/teichoic acid export membrane protein